MSCNDVAIVSVFAIASINFFDDANLKEKGGLL